MYFSANSYQPLQKSGHCQYGNNRTPLDHKRTSSHQADLSVRIFLFCLLMYYKLRASVFQTSLIFIIAYLLITTANIINNDFTYEMFDFSTLILAAENLQEV